MTLERRRPLPPGRYWANPGIGDYPTFEAWVEMARSRSAIAVETVEDLPVDAPGAHAPFYIFQTNTELIWPDAEMGFSPNIAGPDIHSYADTVRVPSAESTMPWAGLNDTVKRFAVIAGVAVVGVAVVSLITSLRRPRR